MRVLRGLGALVALIALLVGIPYGLAVFGGNPFPADWSWTGFGQSLLRPASDRVLIGVVAIAGWIVWVAFATSVIAEVINTLPGRRVRLRLPGLGLGQKLAAVLIIAVVTMIAAPHVQPAVAEPRDSQPAPVAASAAPAKVTSDSASSAGPTPHTSKQRTAPKPASTKAAEKKPQHVVHVVKRGDWLWNLAEHYLGDGSRWTEIAKANPGIDPDRIDVGQRLVIPVDRAPHKATKSHEEKPVIPEAGDTVKVERGDSLSGISEDLYGTPKHWAELYEENKGQISDPDEIEVGQKLQLPDRPVRDDAEHRVHHARQQHRAAHEQAAHEGASRTTTDRGADRAESDKADQATAPQPSASPSTQAARPTEAPADTGRAVQPAPEVHAADQAGQVSTQAVAAVSVGLLLAAGLITALSSRRRRQLHARKPGRQIPEPSPEAAGFEQELEAQHQPLRFEHLDLVARAIAAHCRQTGAELPDLTAVRVADDRIDLLLSRPASTPPPGIDIAADGSVWTVHATDFAAVRAVEGIDEAIPPYPALVTLGRDADTAHVLINLEAAAALTIAADDADSAARMMATIALELALSPWSAELDVTFVGQMLPGFTEGLDHPTVTQIDDVDRVLTGLEHRAAVRRSNLSDTSIGQKHLDPELADAWCPHVVLFGQQLDADQAHRLAGVVTDLPRVAIAAVTTYEALTPWRCELNSDSTAHLSPFDWALTPQLVTDEQYQQLLELVTTSGTDDTRPAPWWDHDADPAELPVDATVTPLPTPAGIADDADEASDPKPDPSEHIDPVPEQETKPSPTPRTRPAPRKPLTLHALVNADAIASRQVAAPAPFRGATTGGGHNDGSWWMDFTSPPAADRPILRLIGEPELVGARGPTNRRYKQRTLEILYYLLEHPGTAMPGLTGQFHLSRDYAKSLVSNLRKTLGTNESGELYLPEMGQRPGYRLHDEVTCDIYLVDQLIGGGVNTAPDEVLIRILAMVRGEPFLGADDWRLGFNLHAVRTDVSSKLTDTAHELTTRALAIGNIKLARWATAQGRAADPLNQTLMADEVRIEAQAGNKAMVTRLADRMSAAARELKADLSDETKEVLRDAIAM